MRLQAADHDVVDQQTGYLDPFRIKAAGPHHLFDLDDDDAPQARVACAICSCCRSIPENTRVAHLEGNLRAPDARLDALVNERTVIGPRYAAATQAEIDTETYPSGC